MCVCVGYRKVLVKAACVGFHLRMKVCLCITLSVQSENSSVDIKHSRSDRVARFLWCLAIGSPLLLSRKRFVIVHTELVDVSLM